MQEPLSFPPCVKGSRTSHAAAVSMVGARARIKARILNFLRAVDGATADDIERACQLSGNTVRPRLLELQRDGFIERTTRERRTRSGRMARVWEAQ